MLTKINDKQFENLTWVFLIALGVLSINPKFQFVVSGLPFHFSTVFSILAYALLPLRKSLVIVASIFIFMFYMGRDVAVPGLGVAWPYLAAAVLVQCSLIIWKIFLFEKLSALQLICAVGLIISLAANILYADGSNGLWLELGLNRWAVNLIIGAIIAEIIILIILFSEGKRRLSSAVKQEMTLAYFAQSALTISIALTGIVILYTSFKTRESDMLIFLKKNEQNYFETHFLVMREAQDIYFSLMAAGLRFGLDEDWNGNISLPLLKKKTQAFLKSNDCDVDFTDIHLEKKVLQNSAKKNQEYSMRSPHSLEDGRSISWGRSSSGDHVVSMPLQSLEFRLTFDALESVYQCFYHLDGGVENQIKLKPESVADIDLSHIMEDEDVAYPFFTTKDVGTEASAIGHRYLLPNPQVKSYSVPSAELIKEYSKNLPGLDQVYTVTSYSSITGAQATQLAEAMRAMVISLFFGVIFARIFSGIVTRPFLPLFRFFEESEKDEIYHPVRSHFSDLNRLQNDFSYTWARVMQAKVDSQNNATQLRELLMSMPLAAAAFDSSGHILMCNLAYNDCVGDDHAFQKAIYMRAMSLILGAPAEEHKFYRDDDITFLFISRSQRDNENMGMETWIFFGDVTDAKKQELQLAQTSKLANLGELATGIAHELNQPLNLINLTVSNMKHLLSLEEVNREKIEGKLSRIDDAVERASKIINHMRAFGRQTDLVLAPISIIDAIQGAGLLMQATLKQDRIELIVNTPENLRQINGEQSRLEQVFINFISNSQYAISTTNPDQRLICIDCTQDESKVTVILEDTGGGMDPEIVSKIFDPFFTTKDVGIGTGLGGSISYGIVKSFGGDISASNGRSGLKIEITFPALL